MGQVDLRLVIPDALRLRHSFICLELLAQASLGLYRSVYPDSEELIGGNYL